MFTPAYRYLRGYSLDPGFSTRLETAGINEVVYRVPFEPLAPGPVGQYLEVVDIDPASGCWYEPVDLGDERIASQQGLPPSEGNPQFHQQFVYAVAMKTIVHFEQALGRKILWHVSNRPIAQLRIHPHALREANAWYDPNKGALLFGYFTAADQARGTNYPNGLVFTCLSPDIVAHETTHALLDAIHHRYIEDTNPDVPAFHEGFADVVALLQRFTFRTLVENRLDVSGGRLDDERFLLGELATQFGEALAGHRGALRSMIGERDADGRWKALVPSPSDYATHVEPHARGAVLVATIFDAFQRVYVHRTRDLVRMAGGWSGASRDGAISRDLVGRLAREAAEIAEHLLHICIRALDYAPPTDITFGSYLRALVTADMAIAPEDESGYRLALIEAFRARGIFPNRVNTLSVESLLWTPPHFTADETREVSAIADRMKPDIRRLVETTDRAELALRSRRAQARLHRLLTGRGSVLGEQAWERFLNKLGLTSRPVSELFGGASRDVRFLHRGRPSTSHVPPLEVHTIRPAFRAGREGRQVEQVIVTLTQQVTADIGVGGTTRPMVFRGGSSLILSLGNLNTVEYVVVKNIRSHDRFREQAAYLNGEESGAPLRVSPYADDERPQHIDFRLLHHT